MDKKIYITYFKGGEKDFIRLLEENGVPYKRATPFPLGTIVNSGEFLEIAKAAVELVALIILKWLKGNASRKVILRTGENGIVCLEAEGYSAEEVSTLIKAAKDISIIQKEND